MPALPYALPSSTPAAKGYTNLIDSTQASTWLTLPATHARNNFVPNKRQWRRYPSSEQSPPALEHILKKLWGHDRFRGPQLTVCTEAMRGNDIIVVAPTGLGKSVCFQLPAVAASHGITLVVSPLIALMKDQVDSLSAKGINVGMLCEHTPLKERNRICRELRMGHPRLRLLYLTPETLFSPKYKSDIDVCARQGQLNRLVIDEAHVIEEWGMTFRPMYRKLGAFRDVYPGIPVTALTASATAEVREDIKTILRIRQSQLAQVVEPFNRRNLFYEVVYRGPEEETSIAEDIAAYIRSYRPEARKRNGEAGVQGDVVTGLVYCRSVRNCVEVADALKLYGIKAKAFHAKLSDAERSQLLDDWKAGLLECMVATIAFGMGVDQAHVRYVFHYDMPKSFEGFYQETGRAGRDGHMSRCVLYYSREDARYLRSLLEKEAAKSMGEEAIRAAETEEEEEAARTAKAQAKKRCINSFKWLQTEYCEKLVCRHVAICRYFGEKIDTNDVELKKAYCDGMCDVCANPAAVARQLCLVNDEIEVASQVVPPTQRPVAFSRPEKSDDEEEPEERIDQAEPSQQRDERVASASKVPRSRLETPKPAAVASSLRREVLRQPLQQRMMLPPSSCTAVTPGMAGKRAPAQPVPAMAVPTKRYIRTSDGFAAGEGSYAEAEPQPQDAKKRKKQRDAFQAVEPAGGDGPFAYYNAGLRTGQGTPVVPSRQDRAGRAASGTSSNRDQFQTPFKTPPARNMASEVTLEMRSETLKSFVGYLATALQQSQKRTELLEHFGHRDPSESRVLVIVKKAARNLEAELAKVCGDARQYRDAVSHHARILHGLSKPEMVQRVISGMLDPSAEVKEEALRLIVERLDLVRRCVRQA